MKNSNNGETPATLRQDNAVAETPISGTPPERAKRKRVGRPKLIDTLTIRRFINIHRSIIYGMMLGDSSIINRGSHATLRVLHAEDQKELVMHKYGLLREVAPTPPRCHLNKWGQPKWYFQTACDSEWQRVWSTFHQDSKTKIVCGKKVIPKVVTPQILKEVDDVGLAMWVMDDGSYTYGHQRYNPERPMNVFRLHTEGYTKEENELIARWFFEKYEVEPTIASCRKQLSDGSLAEYFLIRIGWRQFEKVAKRIERHIIPSMRHKIGAGPLQDKEQLDLNELKTRSDLRGNAQSYQK